MADEQRQELAKFLRSRREQLSPAQVGLPATSRRRTRGLRREEVAVLAGVSPTWYTYLEQARDINPSPEVLDSLSRVLDLDEDERRFLHRLGTGQLPPAGSDPGVETDNQNVLAEIVSRWQKDDYPVYLSNQYTQMIAWNPATTRWYTDFGALPPVERNMLRWMFTDPRAVDRFDDWDTEARNMVGRMRAASAARSWDAGFTTFVRALSEESPAFRTLWQELHVHDQHTRVRRMRVPGIGLVSARIVVIRPSDDAFNSIVIHLPE